MEGYIAIKNSKAHDTESSKLSIGGWMNEENVVHTQWNVLFI